MKRIRFRYTAVIAMRRLFSLLGNGLLLFCLLSPPLHAGEKTLDLYFFWSKTCPHCLTAHPFVESLPKKYDWLELHSLEVSTSPANAERYTTMARQLGEEARAVPAFIYCGRMEVGFELPESSGAALELALQRCHAGIAQPAASAPAVTLPGLGSVDLSNWSLPVLTIVLAGLDAFNPCAFFVLLFLLSLLVHAGSRVRMLFIGGVFLFFSGLIYFLFMAAWLSAFRWLGEMAMVTAGAGWLAILIALINIKDYFWFKQGVSLSIPEAAKPGLYHRMRGLLKSDNLPALTLGTIALAVAANSYELLCTAGFPMVYTRLLTLAELPPAAYYGWLALYNVIYILPLLAITLVFTFTLGARKLSEGEGRLLKLVSGLMMLALGVLLVLRPDALNHLGVALGLPVFAVALSALIHHARKKVGHD